LSGVIHIPRDVAHRLMIGRLNSTGIRGIQGKKYSCKETTYASTYHAGSPATEC
jgi:hypothetical protein